MSWTTHVERLQLPLPHPIDARHPLAIADAGFVVNIRQGGGRYVATATRPDGQTWITRAPDAYTAACELPQAVGIDLADG